VASGIFSAAAKAAPASGQLGSFMYVKNSRYDGSALRPPTPDNPRFWVGRVAEIMRGGRMRLHWHRFSCTGALAERRWRRCAYDVGI
jgi:hypothetical protein